jgi:mediator of RNA polymerase II transcription subunit 13
VDGWDRPSPSLAETQSNLSKTSRNDYPTQGPGFIIAWINVENKQGEDKGMFIIYPSSLCLSFTPSPSSHISAASRQPLSYIPELPAPLQPSPHVLSAPSSAMVSRHQSRTNTPLPVPIPIPSVIASFSSTSLSEPASALSRPSLPSSPTSEALRTFRSLTLSKSKEIHSVATEVGGFVDAVARERERERERLKRERETTGTGGPTSVSPRLARTTPAASAPAPVATNATPLLSAPNLVDGPSTSAITPTIPSTTTAVPAGASNLLAAQTQNFYPSPPQNVLPSVVAQTSPSASTEIADTPAPGTSATPSATIAVPPPNPNSSYDPFGNIDTSWQSQPDPSWSESQAPYLGMDFDDMGFGMGMTMSGSRSGSGAYNAGGTGMDFEDAFTDDDFSFFDRPSRASTTTTAPPPVMGVSRGGSGLTPSAGPAPLGMSPPLFNDIHLTGPGSIHQTPTPQAHSHLSAAWVPGILSEGFTPRFTDDVSSLVPPDLLPPSPGQTPSSHSAPATPSVHLEHDSATIRRPSTGATSGWYGGSGIFDPIPFSSYHRVADGKYANGKFALPSPPDEEDRTEPLQMTSKFFQAFASSSTSLANDWRSKYVAATDPRIGVVRKLKRKMNEQGGREPDGSRGTVTKSPPWMREREEWEMSTTDEGMQDDDVKSDPESDEDDDFVDIDSPVVSRPSTPPPVYLPLGPTLLQTQFQHSHLLPLSTPLRPPGAAVAATSLSAATSMTSVPTPVSPAATMGAASEKSKSLEAAAFTVATEVVENSLWAEAWRASTLGLRMPAEVWPADVRTINQILEAVPALEGPLDVGALFDAAQKTSDGSIKPLQISEAPQISLEKTTAILDLAPTSIRFWEKLGLGPKGGKKNGTSFVLFEPGDEQRHQQIDNWLSSVVVRYEVNSTLVCYSNGLLTYFLAGSTFGYLATWTE